MFKRKLFVIALILTIVSSIAIWVGTSKATSRSGVTQSLIVTASLADPVQLNVKVDGSGFGNVLEVTNLSMVKIIVAPGGSFGWQQHGGPAWAVIQSGTLTLYSGRIQSHDPVCQGKEYGPGSAFLDPGDHTYNARNEGNVDVVVYATFMLPEGGAARIDVPGPGNCPS